MSKIELKSVSHDRALRRWSAEITTVEEDADDLVTVAAGAWMHNTAEVGRQNGISIHAPTPDDFDAIADALKEAANRMRLELAQVPTVGSPWMNRSYRGRWTIKKIGTKYVTLRSTIPGGGELRVQIIDWPSSWTPA